ncbi:MAG: OmpA family protein [Coriobacteriales bacterium]|nr:OmpA family protein [Coriobacteriales bacterium]
MRREAKAFLIGLVLVSAVCLCACGRSGSASAVVGAYGIDPSEVSTARLQNVSDAALVVAPCQGQAFRIPTSALGYSKAAIENEGYASVVRADNAQVDGKVYGLTKNSQSGRQSEAKVNELDYFSYAVNRRATEEGVLLLESINAAAADLKAQATGDARVICVVASGITNGILATTPELLSMAPDEVVAQLKSMSAIGDMSGIEVRFYGLGQSTGDQEIPTSAAARIEDLMSAIVIAGGGTPVMCSDRLAPLSCDSQLPAVPVVSFTPDAVVVPAVPAGQSAEVVLTDSVLTFRGDSAEFADPEAAQAALLSVAKSIREHGYRVTITGHTADTGAGDGLALSQARAQAVERKLVTLGVDQSQIVEVRGVGCSESTSFANGAFDENRARLDRKVVLTISA